MVSRKLRRSMFCAKPMRGPMTLNDFETALREEIVQVTGGTEPVSVAFAFLTARRHLRSAFDPLKVTARLTASAEVLRNASTAVTPFLNRRGLRAVVAAGLASKANQFDLFPTLDRRMVRILLRRRNWLKTGHSGQRRGVHVRATLTMPTESVSVVIEGRHDEIRSVARNGKIIFSATPARRQPFGLTEIMAVVAQRNRRLESIARDFILRQARGNLSWPVPKRMAALIQARMCGDSMPIMTIVGSGNHGLMLGVPFYALYRKYGSRILPAVLLTLLAVIHMTEQHHRISDACGLATKAAPALAAGLAYAQGADRSRIERLMADVARAMPRLKCHGARATCGGKACRALKVVMAQVKAMTGKEWLA